MRILFRSRHVLITMSLMALLGPPSSAQVLVIEPGSETGPASPAPPPSTVSEPLVMLVSPAAEPAPALKFRFWLAHEERRPGNAMVHIQRALLMDAERTDRADREREMAERWEAWTTHNLEEVPREELRAYLAGYRNVLEELYQLPYLERSEYDLRFQELTGLKVFSIMLPELQRMRGLGRLLQLDIQLALAEGRHDDALRSIRVGFRLGESAGTATPILIGRLVGIAITSLMLEQVRVAATIPEAPNYYWALATLPDSMWDMRESIKYELNALLRLNSTLSSLPDESLEPAAWRRRLLVALSEFHQFVDATRPDSRESGGPNANEVNPAVRLGAGMLIIGLDGLAREYLESVGIDSTEMTPSEAVFRATHHDLVRLRDDELKWVLLPGSLGRGSESEWNLAYDPFEYRPHAPIPFPAARVLANLLAPSVRAAQEAGLRGRQTVAVLATAEALRMHAARHGQFPETLDQLDPVPAWPDPIANNSFSYDYRSPGEVVIQRSPTTYGWRPPDLLLHLRVE